MFAVSVCEVAHAFATRVARLADSHVVASADAGAVNREASAADFAKDFFDGVVTGFAALRNGKCRDATVVRRVDEPNTSLRFRIRSHGASV